ncbi:uncharacterized protein AB675_2499 [Cyphellophora attinorum]|uniref:HPP transmembrane region domain-containing protein n=1 Tax=Cyphellophora attinorum TaxID=1664694 RepID=A0A0N1HH52_9EURO|nr:uncharacterized protein AB675_2499 [Phialophora attinorum]KPI45210.1 hypothetical protein AB675_2499 [Phialophora attinorum]
MAPSNPYDVDAYTNPYTPSPPFRHLPQPIAHFFGHRRPNAKPQQPHTLLVWFFCFIGAFLGVSLLCGVYLNLPTSRPPSLIGVSITKLFHLLPYAEFNKLRWLAGALSVGSASVVMAMTKTVHPPAGATALLASTEIAITELGWWFLALMLLGSMLMLTAALIINNLTRRFPVYWWTPADLKSIKAQRKAKAAAGNSDDGRGGDIEKASEAAAAEARHNSNAAAKRTDSAPSDTGEFVGHKGRQIIIDAEKIVIPDWLQADEWEVQILEILHQRLKNGAGAEEG